jgi:hypothetical protein
MVLSIQNPQNLGSDVPSPGQIAINESYEDYLKREEARLDETERATPAMEAMLADEEHAELNRQMDTAADLDQPWGASDDYEPRALNSDVPAPGSYEDYLSRIDDMRIAGADIEKLLAEGSLTDDEYRLTDAREDLTDLVSELRIEAAVRDADDADLRDDLEDLRDDFESRMREVEDDADSAHVRITSVEQDLSKQEDLVDMVVEAHYEYRGDLSRVSDDVKMLHRKYDRILDELEALRNSRR